MTALGRKPANLHPYAWDVLQGRVVVGELVRLACERSLRDHRDAKDRGLVFKRRKAERVVQFFPRFLVHTKGEWARKPFVLEAWQEFILWEVFGWYNADGSRRFREAYNELARKQGKTQILGGVGLFMTLADAEAGAETYTIATKRDQAKIMHAAATSMVKASPYLSAHFKIMKDRIIHPASESFYIPLGADSKTLDGLNVYCGLADELHAHPNGDLYQVIKTATGARVSPLIFSITTAGDDELSFCYQQREYAVAVLKGALEDDTFFAYIACLDEGDDWRDPAVWVKANPNLGVTVKIDALAKEVRQAEQSPAKQNSVRRLKLNQWTRATTRFLDLAQWDENAGDLMPAEIERANVGRPMWAGLDLSTTTDVSAFVGLFPPEDLDDGAFDVLCRFWIPADNIEERERKTRVPYTRWVRDGFLIATPGNVIDYREIRREVNDLGAAYGLREISHDAWGSTALATDLQGDGFAMVKVRQGPMSMSPPTKELEKLVLSKRIRHGGHPVLRWMADNLEVKTDSNGNVAPVKPGHKMSHKKIDGMVALIMAIAAAEAGARAQGPQASIYESRGILTL